MKIKDLVLKEIKGFWGEEPAENEKGIPVIKTNNLTYEGVINYSDLCYRSIDVNKVKDNFLIKGDLLIEKSGGTKTHSVGYVSYFDGTDNTYVCNNFILGLRINENIVRPKYIFYILKYMYENGYFAHCYKQTTGIQNLKKDLYLDFDIQVPDFQTQDNIINVLDKITTSTTKDQQKLKKYDDLVKSQFIEMFKDCTETTLCKISKITMGQSPSSSSYNDDGKGIAFFQGKADFGDKYTIVKHFTTEPTKLAEKDDVLISVRAPVGPVNIASQKCCIGRGLASIRAFENYSTTEFLYYMLKSKESEIAQRGTGSTFKAINRDTLYNLVVPKACIELQNQFADFVKHIDKLKFTIKLSIEKLELCYKSLMKQYFE